MLSKIYWGSLALFSTIHLQLVISSIAPSFPLYITFSAAIILIFFLYKKIDLQIVSHHNMKLNTILWVLQILNILLYIDFETVYSKIIPLLIFIGLECIRYYHASKIYFLTKTIDQYENEREQFNKMFMAVREERHDFLKHVSALQFIMDKGQNKEALNYLNGLISVYEETNLAIKGERGVVAGILHQIYKQAKAYGIEIIYDLDIPVSSMKLSDKEIVTLLGNLLSNSIEASHEWQEQHNKQAQISLQFYKRSGLNILICKNNSIPIPNNILDKLYQTYGNTTKGSGHEGLGTKLIHDVVREHNGFLDFVHKNETFTVKIKIP